MKKLPVYKYLDISTAHITEETEVFLWRQVQDEDGDLIVYKKECGYFIHVPCDPDELNEMEVIIPHDLMACLRLAMENNCYWLVLDADAEVINELETFEWQMEENWYETN